jgi:hypothetical protein
MHHATRYIHTYIQYMHVRGGPEEGVRYGKSLNLDRVMYVILDEVLMYEERKKERKKRSLTPLYSKA